MSLDMDGFIDDEFQSIDATRIPQGGSYVDGLWVAAASAPIAHKVTIQALSEREIDSLALGGERILDMRKIYVNDGVLASITPADIWSFDGQQWKAVKMDNRPWRNYCKIIVSRFDQQ